MKQKERLDRRVQRTRGLLSHALMELVVEKDYDSITVQDIIDRANLGRSTFYAHYMDKDDLLFSGMDEVVHSLLPDAPPLEEGRVPEGLPIVSSLPIFRHAQEQYALHKAIVGGRGIEVVIRSIQDHLSEHILDRLDAFLAHGRSPSVPAPVIARHLSGALINLLIWWLDNDMPYPPERMEQIFQQLTGSGVRAALEAGKGS